MIQHPLIAYNSFGCHGGHIPFFVVFCKCASQFSLAYSDLDIFLCICSFFLVDFSVQLLYNFQCMLETLCYCSCKFVSYVKDGVICISLDIEPFFLMLRSSLRSLGSISGGKYSLRTTFGDQQLHVFNKSDGWPLLLNYNASLLPL